MKALIVLGIVLIALSSCNMQNYCSRHYPPIASKDSSSSITTTYIPHDSAEKQPADSSLYYALIECEKNNAGQFVPVIKNQSTTQGERIKTKVELRHDTIYMECKIDTFSVIAKWNAEHSVITTHSHNTDIQRVNYLTNGQIFWMIWGKILTVILIISAIVLIIIKFSKSNWFSVAITAIKAIVKITTKE